MILDLTVLQEHVTTRKKQDRPVATKKTANHQINSACAILCLDQDLYEFPYETIKDKEFYIDYVKDDSEEECENLITRFVEHLNNLADIVTTWLRTIDVNKQLRELKFKHWKEFKQAKRCIYCHRTFHYTRTPVFDHNHTRSTYNGASCSECNLLATKQRNLSCFFHNLPYDSNLLLQHMNFGKLNEETWSASMIGQKLKLMSTTKLEIRDSFALLPSKLAD